MAYIRKRRKKWQVVIRKKGHPYIAKSFTSYSLATSWAQESEANIAKGLFADMSEANQTTLRETLRANDLRVLKYGIILKSQACLLISKTSKKKAAQSGLPKSFF